MSRRYILILLTLSFACTTSKSTNTSNTSPAGNSGINKENPLEYGLKKQIFHLTSEKDTIISERLTLIITDKNKLIHADGTPILPGEKIEMHLIEAITREEIIKMGRSTITDNGYLYSSGVFQIDIYADGKKLKIKEGQTLTVLLPNYGSENTRLYYWNTKAENWQLSATPEAIEPGNYRNNPKTRTILLEDSVKKILPRSSLNYSEKRYNEYIKDMAFRLVQGCFPRGYQVQLTNNLINITQLGYFNLDNELIIKDFTYKYVSINKNYPFSHLYNYVIFDSAISFVKTTQTNNIFEVRIPRYKKVSLLVIRQFNEIPEFSLIKVINNSDTLFAEQFSPLIKLNTKDL